MGERGIPFTSLLPIPRPREGGWHVGDETSSALLCALAPRVTICLKRAERLKAVLSPGGGGCPFSAVGAPWGGRSRALGPGASAQHWGHEPCSRGRPLFSEKCPGSARETVARGTDGRHSLWASQAHPSAAGEPEAGWRAWLASRWWLCPVLPVGPGALPALGLP